LPRGVYGLHERFGRSHWSIPSALTRGTAAQSRTAAKTTEKRDFLTVIIGAPPIHQMAESQSLGHGHARPFKELRPKNRRPAGN
jgi:hypothetical protein